MALFASRGYGETRRIRQATLTGRLRLTDALVTRAEAKAGHAQADVRRMIQQSETRVRKAEVAIVLLRILPGDHAGI